MKRQFRLAEQARYDLLSIWSFIARDSIASADRVMSRIQQACASLARFPRKGHRRPDVYTDEPVLFWPVGSYFVVYRPSPKPILIVRILHSARDLNALL